MRIISGSARGRKLAEFKGTGIRPTPDRVREALFSMLISRFGDLQGLNVLELCAGSGAMSLEALSRGAVSALLVDSSRQAAQLINGNISRCRMQEQAKLILSPVEKALGGSQVQESYDLIFMDPPYHKGLVPVFLQQIDSLNLLAQNGIISAETEANEIFELPDAFALLETRRYGSSAVHLIVHQNTRADQGPK